MNFPLTVGIVNPDDPFLDPFLLGRVGAFSIVPGVEFSVPLRSNWRLMPFVDLGVVWDDASHESSALAGAGLKSLVQFSGLGFEFRFFNRLLYATQTKDLFSGKIDNIGAFDTGLEARRLTSWRPFGYPFEWSVYGTNYLYFDQPDLATTIGGANEVRVQNESGGTVAVSTDARFSLMRNPRIGLGYRAGDQLTFVRLVLGSPF